MKAKLAEMEALLNQPVQTINYWQPKDKEAFYYISYLGEVIYAYCNYTRNYQADKTRYRVFQTITEAQKYTDYIKAEETLRKAIAEANKGWTPDWYNSNDNKFYVYINRNNLGIEQHNWEKFLPTFMYIKNARLARQLIEEYKQEFITYLSY